MGVDTSEPNSFTLNPIPEKQTNLTEKTIKMLSRLIPHLKNVPKRSYMHGLGSRSEQNSLPRSLTIAGIKQEWSLIPLYVVMTIAMTGVVYYCGRLAIQGSDVSWMKEAEPWNYYSDKEFKIIKQGTEAHRVGGTTAAPGRNAPDYKA